jgi:cyclophilin family peptidyl-prolyl cis-trans isomerase
MKIAKLRKFLAVFLLGVTILIGGCSAQATTSPPAATTPSSLPSKTAATTLPSTSAAPVSTTMAATAAATSQPSAAAARKTYSTPPVMQIDKTKKYSALMDTSLGSFKIELFASESPVTVNNFVFLSREGFYNGVIFHRIMKTFMIQTGDPKGTGMGGPGYKFADELPVKHSYEPGIVAMANSGPNTNGSQFFICTGASAKSLDQHAAYSQFGKVIEGMETVMKIASVPVGLSESGEQSKPTKPPVINSITITEE